MFSGVSQQLLLLLLLFNVSPDGFQTIHIQAGMMRWLQAGEDQREVLVQPFPLVLTSATRCLRNSRAGIWCVGGSSFEKLLFQSLIISSVPLFLLFLYIFLGAGTRGSPGHGWGLSLFCSRRLLLNLRLLRLRFRRDEALHLLGADGHLVRLQPALQVLQRAGDSKGTPL